MSLREKLHLVKLGILASIPEAICFCSSIIACAAETSDGGTIQAKVSKTSNSLWSVIKVVAMSLMIVVLAVCGLILILGTQKMKEAVKEHFYSIVIGTLILFLAKDIAEYMESTFG